MKNSFKNILVLLLLAALALSVMASCDRAKSQAPETLLESEHYTVTDNELAVFRFIAAQAQLSNQYGYYQYGLIQAPEGFFEDYPTLTDYLEAHLPEVIKTDAYMTMAVSHARECLVTCEGGLAAGLTTDGVDASELEEAITTIKGYADGIEAPLEKYIQTHMGAHVTEADIRSAYEKILFSTYCADQMRQKLMAEISEEDVISYREAHKSSFYRSYCDAYTLVNFEKMADAAEKCTSVEEIKVMLVDYMVSDNFERLYKQNIQDADIEDPNGKDILKAMVYETLLAVTDISSPDFPAPVEHFTASMQEPLQQACYQIVQAIRQDLQVELGRIKTQQKIAYVDSEDPQAPLLSRWLFSEGRQTGDLNIIREDRVLNDHVMYQYTWVLAGDLMGLNENWEENARAGATDEAYDAWYAQMQQAHSIKQNFSDDRFKDEGYENGFYGQISGNTGVETFKVSVDIIPLP